MQALATTALRTSRHVLRDPRDERLARCDAREGQAVLMSNGAPHALNQAYVGEGSPHVTRSGTCSQVHIVVRMLPLRRHNGIHAIAEGLALACTREAREAHARACATALTVSAFAAFHQRQAKQLVVKLLVAIDVVRWTQAGHILHSLVATSEEMLEVTIKDRAKQSRNLHERSIYLFDGTSLTQMYRHLEGCIRIQLRQC